MDDLCFTPWCIVYIVRVIECESSNFLASNIMKYLSGLGEGL